jgi:hypothetical protein
MYAFHRESQNQVVSRLHILLQDFYEWSRDRDIPFPTVEDFLFSSSTFSLETIRNCFDSQNHFELVVCDDIANKYGQTVNRWLRESRTVVDQDRSAWAGLAAYNFISLIGGMYRPYMASQILERHFYAGPSHHLFFTLNSTKTFSGVPAAEYSCDYFSTRAHFLYKLFRSFPQTPEDVKGVQFVKFFDNAINRYSIRHCESPQRIIILLNNFISLQLPEGCV